MADTTFKSTSGSGAQSQTIAITDIISEGPIYGLVNGASSVFLNDDRAEGLELASQSLSKGPITVALVNGSPNATIENGSIGTLAGTNKYFVIRKGLGSTTVALTQNPQARTNTKVNELTASSAFFTSDMVSGLEHRTGDTFNMVPVRLNKPGLQYEGIIYGITSSTVAGFQQGSGAVPVDLVIPDDDYLVSVDKVINIQTISEDGTTVVLEDNWAGTTASYSFDVYGAVENSTTEAPLTANPSRSYTDFTAQFRSGTLMQPPLTGEGGEGSNSITHTPSSLPPLEQTTEFGGLAAATELLGTSSTQGFGLTAEQAKEADEVRITISYNGGLFQTKKDDGSRKQNWAFYKISAAVKLPGAASFSTPVVLQEQRVHTHSTNNSVVFQEVIGLEQFKPYDDFKIIISRISEHDGDGYNSDGSRSGKNSSATSSISSVTTVIKEVLNYPYTALAKVTFNSKQFQQMPTRTYHTRGLLVQVPSNYVTREEAGGDANYNRNITTGAIEASYQNWDGAFRPDIVYTNNPAWVFYDIMSNNRYGLGAFLSASQIDKFALYRIARYCDDLVPDGKGGMEPRFTANLYLTKASDAYKVIKDVSTIFRSMIYWMDGQVFPVIDQAKDPVYNFSKSNVLDGAFSYEGTGSKTRANQVIVSWNNPDDNYALSPLLIEDKLNIIETGRVIPQTAVAFGCTSEGQALRYGRWKLWTAINQTEVVSFSTSINAAFIAPGDIVNIQDADRNAVRFSGRVSSSTTPTTTSLTLDAPINLISNRTYDISVLIVEPGAFLAQDSAVISTITYNRGDLIPSITTEAASYNTVDDSGNPVTLSWSEYTRVETAPINNTIPASNVTSITIDAGDAFTAAPSSSTVWVIQEKDSDGFVFAGSPKQYKVLSITQSSDTKYDITAVEHYNEKFDSIENDFNAYVEDTVLPSVRPTDIVPAPKDVHVLFNSSKQTPGEELEIRWVAPDGETVGAEYEFLAGYEIQHNIPGHKSPIIVSKSLNSYALNNVDDGSHFIMVRTINTLENRSPGKKISVTVLDRFSANTTRYPLGMPYGGKSTVGISIDGSGQFSLKDSVYVLEPAHPNAAIFENEDNTSGKYQQDCSSMATVAGVQGTSGEFFEDHYYIVLDKDGGNDRLKLLKYNTSFADAYWFDAGNGSETSGLVTKTGTITKAAYSSKIVGVGTSFTTECKVGEVFKGINQYDICRVTHIKSDTELTIDRAGPTAYASQGFQTTNFYADYVNDTLIARVYKTTGGYFTVPLISVSGAPLVAGTIGDDAITDANIVPETLTDASIQPNTITNNSIARQTILGESINRATRVEVYQTDGNDDVISDTYAALDGANDLWRIYSGSETAQDAPFRVSKYGRLIAKNMQLYKSDGTIYFDSATGFSDDAIAQIASATGSRVHSLNKTLSADLNTGSPVASTYQEIIITETSDVTVSYKVPVDGFSKYLSEEYFGTAEAAAYDFIVAYIFGATYDRTDLNVVRGASVEPLGRALKGGEIVKIALSYMAAGQTTLENITGATQLDGSAFPAVTNFTASQATVYFKMVAGQQFSFKVKRPTYADITFNTGENNSATPDLSAQVLTNIPSLVKARLFRRTAPTDTSPATIIDNWSSNTFSRITTGSPSATEYLINKDTDNVAIDSIIESEFAIDINNGAVDDQGYITKSTTISSLAAGTYYFDIELDFTGGIAPIVEGSRIFTASVPFSSAGFLVGEDGGGGQDAGDIESVIAGTNIVGGATSGDATVSLADSISLSNITLAGYLRGPSNFTIDPAAHGDDTGTLIIAGNLQVDGVTTTINSTTVTIDDKNLVIASGAANAAAANGAGITIDGANAALTYVSATDNFKFDKPLNINTHMELDSSTGTTTSTTQTSIATFAHATYSGAKIVVTATSNGERHICELLVTHDGTTAVSTQYGSVLTDGELATFDVDISGSDVRLLATSATATSTTYKVSKQLLT